MKAGLQLYSIGEAMRQDPLAAIAQVGAMGYQGVEFAGYFDQSAQALRQAVEQAGMVTCGSHIGLDQLTADLPAVMAYEAELGNRNIIVPWMAFDTLDAWYAQMAKLEDMAQTLNAQGFNLIYHNHGHELMTFAGVDLLDEMTRRTQHVQLEVDVYWLAYAGKVVLPWLNAHAQRIAMLHIKDMALYEGSQESVMLGTGTLPLSDHVTFAHDHGLEWLVVEQEAFSQAAPMAAATENATFLNELIRRISQ